MTEKTDRNARLIEQYINNLNWSEDASDNEKTLVAGNIRAFYFWSKKNFAPPSIHVNDEVRVKLTDYGRKILRKQFDERRAQNPKVFKEFHLPEEDSDGWSAWTFWDLVNSFSIYMTPGSEIPFHGEIELVVKRGKETL